MSELDLKYLRELAGQATPTTKDAELCRYEHGGGRLVVFEGERRLIADFYDEPNREFYAALNPQTAIALLDAIERLTKEVIEERRASLAKKLVAEVRIEAAEAARDEARAALEMLTDEPMHWDAGIKRLRAALHNWSSPAKEPTT